MNFKQGQKLAHLHWNKEKYYARAIQDSDERITYVNIYYIHNDKKVASGYDKNIDMYPWPKTSNKEEDEIL